MIAKWRGMLFLVLLRTIGNQQKFPKPVYVQYFLIVVNSFSKWLEVLQVNLTSSATIHVLKHYFENIDVSGVLVSDNVPTVSENQ